MKYPISRKAGIVVQELDGEVLIYDLNEDKAFCLNETSALVWELCDGTKSAADIALTVNETLNVGTGSELVWLALDQLKREKLVAGADNVPADLAGMSRRDVIKKVGLTSLVALPIVASIAAPTAAHAASGCPAPGVMTITENQFCTNSCQCRGQADGMGGFNPSTCCQISPADSRLVCREVPGSPICV